MVGENPLNRSTISILAPSRERRFALRGLADEVCISILAPSRERRFIQLSFINMLSNFNPRSLTGATFQTMTIGTYALISILAPSRERPLA